MPDADDATRQLVATNVIKATTAARANLALQREVERRLPDLAQSGTPHKITRKLQNWSALNFSEFRAEVKKTLKSDIPLHERGAWETYLEGKKAAFLRNRSTIEKAEKDTDSIFSNVFGIDDGHKALLSASSFK